MAITLQKKLKALPIERQEKIYRRIAELIEQEMSFKSVANNSVDLIEAGDCNWCKTSIEIEFSED